MSTEGRFNSSLLKSSGCSWETKAGTYVVGNNEGDAQRLHISRADSTWSPTRAEKPSLRHSSSTCSFMVVNGAIIIALLLNLERTCCNRQQAHLVHHSPVRYPNWFNSMFEFCPKLIQFNIQFNIVSRKFNSKDYSIQNHFKKIQFKRLFNSKLFQENSIQ